MDRIDRMKTFVAVAETGSFSAAAIRLGISNKLVSKEIRALEEDVGATLFFRTTRSMSITAEGREYQQGCRRVLLEFDALSASLDNAQNLKGSLRVSVPVTLGELLITASVVDFLELHRDIKVELSLSDSFVDLAEHGFDLAIRIGEMRDSSLKMRLLGQTNLIVVGAPTYFENFGRPDQPSDLSQHNCIRDSNGNNPNRWPFIVDGTQMSVPVNGRLMCNSSSSCLNAARKGHGLAMVPDLFAEQNLIDGRLTRVLDHLPPVSADIRAVYLPSGFQRPKLTAFVDHMKDAISNAMQRCEKAGKPEE